MHFELERCGGFFLMRYQFSRYWIQPSSIGRTLALALALPLISAQATTITLDFTGIPDGTLVSANNPYAGVVNFSGQADFQLIDDSQFPPTASHLLIENGAIRSGGIWMGVSPWPVLPPSVEMLGPPGLALERVYATLTATFLEPVRGLTFTTGESAYYVAYIFDGLDANGSPFHGFGQSYNDIPVPPGSFSHMTILDAPEGGYFTKLTLSNWSYWDPEFEVYDITLRGVGVPEPAPLTDKVVLGLILAAAPFVRRGNALGLGGLRTGARAGDRVRDEKRPCHRRRERPR